MICECVTLYETVYLRDCHKDDISHEVKTQLSRIYGLENVYIFDIDVDSCHYNEDETLTGYARVIFERTVSLDVTFDDFLQVGGVTL